MKLLFTLLALLLAITSTVGLPIEVFSDNLDNRNSTELEARYAKAAPWGKMRGVNLGGWLVLENWMTPDLFDGIPEEEQDQWHFDQQAGAEAKLKTHWNTYITEKDIQKIKTYGINALRIPVGFWAYDNASTPYIKGADAYVDKVITWARRAGMRVIIDLHGAPGSQNGQEHSGHEGAVDWDTSANLAKTIKVLQIMAHKYGAPKYADVVFAIELVNEPDYFDGIKEWTENAFAAVRKVANAAGNPDLRIIMHDAFWGPQSWLDVNTKLNHGVKSPLNTRFGIDTHEYQLYTDSDNSLTQEQHISHACDWATDLATAQGAVLPVIVGEFSVNTNICINSDGSSFAGTSCNSDSCQCVATTPFDEYSPALIAAVRRYTEAQLDVFETRTNGWFLWSLKGQGAWSFDNVINNGIFPNPVWDRKYPGQCKEALKNTRDIAYGDE